MRDVRFKELAAAGPHPGSWTHERLEVFALRLAPVRYALRVKRVMPGLDALNREFRKGRDDQGMGGGTEWKPFEIDAREYAELREAWLADPEPGLRP